MTDGRFGSASALGEPNSLDVGAAGEGLAGAGDDDRLDRGVGDGLVQPVDDAARGSRSPGR